MAAKGKARVNGRRNIAELEAELDRRTAERDETLAREAATAEVLQGHQFFTRRPRAPVFDAILDKAHGLCGIALGALQLFDGGKFRAVAVRGVTGTLAELLRQLFDPPPGSPPSRRADCLLPNPERTSTGGSRYRGTRTFHVRRLIYQEGCLA